MDEIQTRHDDFFAFPGCYRLPNLDSSRVSAVMREDGLSPGFLAKEYNHVGIPVLKLHGSLNWQSNHTSKVPTPQALRSPTRRMYVLDSKSVLHSLSWRQKNVLCI